MGTPLKPTFFASADAFRHWLEGNHRAARELWVGFYKVNSAKKGISYQEAVDEALCFGWIDGLKKRVDKVSYVHRFTPRKARSIWSDANTRRAQALKNARRMAGAGLDAFAARDPSRAGLYSFENRDPAFDAAAAKRFRAGKKAWAFFAAQPPGYRRTATHWVMSAKRLETRKRRLAQLIDDSARGRRLAILSGSGMKPVKA